MADLSKLVIAPERSGYKVKFGSPVVLTQLQGGSPKVRKDFIGMIHQVDVQWSLGREGYKYLKAFYRTAVDKGSLPFLIDLLLDDADVYEYQVWFLPDSFVLASQAGMSYIVTATLLVLPRVDDPDGDLVIIAAFTEPII